MKYTFRSEKELQGVIQASTGIPQKVIDNAKYHIGLVEECFEDGACGNFHILTDDDGTDAYWGFFYKCKTREVCYGKKEQLITEVVYQGNHTYVEKNSDDNTVKRRIRKKQDD